MKMKSLIHQVTLFDIRLEALLSTHVFTVLFVLFYLLSLFLMFVLGFYTEFVEKFDSEVVRWFISFARGTGYTLNLNTPFILLLSSRLFLTHLRRTFLSHILPLDEAFPSIHILAGYIILVSVIFHAGCHLTWIIVGDAWSGNIFGFTSSVVTGFVIFFTLLLIWMVTWTRFRSKHFRAFRFLHVSGAVLFFVLLIFHGNFRQKPEVYKWLIPAFIVYTLDRVLRRLNTSSAVLSLTADNAALQGDILVLRVPRPFKFHAGQYAEIRVPSISMEWHPFTIASAPHEEEASFFIKINGDWTGKLRDEMQQRLQGDEDRPLKVVLRGPFGAPSQHVEAYKRVVLISGGVGATPFASICKSLHFKNVQDDLSGYDTTQENPDAGSGEISKYDERVRVAISNLFDVDTYNAFSFSAEDEQKSVHITNMLNLTGNRGSEDFASENARSSDYAGSSNERAISNLSKESSSSDDPLHDRLPHHKSTYGNKKTDPESHTKHKVSVEDEEDVLQRLSVAARLQQTNRRKLAHMYDVKAKLLGFLHTARVQFLLMLIMLVRLTVAGVGCILSKGEPEFEFWVPYANAPMALIFGIVLLLTIGLELCYMKKRYFHDIGRCMDLFVFVPLIVASIVVDVNAAASKGYRSLELVILQHAVFLPLLFVLLLIRLHRSLRLRALLTKCIDQCKEEPRPEVDFIWTTREESDDGWLRGELSPLAEGTNLRLHRYVTRTEEVDVEVGADILSSVHAGRPEFDKLFQNIAASAPSKSVIGVFFCGPKKMGAAVQAALRRAEIVSHLRAAYLNRTPERTLVSDLGVPRGFMVRRLQKRGCSVRFVYHEENFG